MHCSAIISRRCPWHATNGRQMAVRQVRQKAGQQSGPKRRACLPVDEPAAPTRYSYAVCAHNLRQFPVRHAPSPLFDFCLPSLCSCSSPGLFPFFGLHLCDLLCRQSMKAIYESLVQFCEIQTSSHNCKSAGAKHTHIHIYIYSWRHWRGIGK